MFTGIIEEIGDVREISKQNQSVLLRISCSKVLHELTLGDSICVNGVCLTVKRFDSISFTADVMPETVSKTSLDLLKTGSKVNLERALTLNSRIGGHIVTGHIDGTGIISGIKENSNALLLEIFAKEHIMKYIISKGSVCVDGTSLTIAKASENSFTVSLIPHTQKMSVVSEKKAGDLVNIECDVLGKYIEKFLSFPNINSSKTDKKDITVSFLSENGFL